MASGRERLDELAKYSLVGQPRRPRWNSATAQHIGGLSSFLRETELPSLVAAAVSAPWTRGVPRGIEFYAFARFRSEYRLICKVAEYLAEFYMGWPLDEVIPVPRIIPSPAKYVDAMEMAGLQTYRSIQRNGVLLLLK